MIRKQGSFSSDDSEVAIPPVEVVALAPSLEEGYTLTCPVCECEFVHLIGTGVLDNKKLILQAGDGFHVVGMERKCRGSAIVSIFQCENQHTWSRREQFHKGQVTVTLRAYHDADMKGCELWRN